MAERMEERMEYKHANECCSLSSSAPAIFRLCHIATVLTGMNQDGRNGKRKVQAVCTILVAQGVYCRVYEIYIFHSEQRRIGSNSAFGLSIQIPAFLSLFLVCSLIIFPENASFINSPSLAHALEWLQANVKE